MKKVIQHIYNLNSGGAEAVVRDYAINLNSNDFHLLVLCLRDVDNSPHKEILLASL